MKEVLKNKQSGTNAIDHDGASGCIKRLKNLHRKKSCFEGV